MLATIHSPDRRPGYALVEVIIATGIVVTIATAFVTLSLGSYEGERGARERTIAAHYAREGLEAVRSIADRNFVALTEGNHGLDASGGYYAFSGTENTFGDYTRTVTVGAVERDADGGIVTSGGTDDPSTRSVTSAVTWNGAQGGVRTVSLVTYVTQWNVVTWFTDLLSEFQSFYRNGTQSVSADDGEAKLEGAAAQTSFSANLPGVVSVNELAVDRIRDRLMIILDRGADDVQFLSHDISNVSSRTVTQSGALELGGTSNGFALGKDYAYVLTNIDGQEVRVVRLRDFQIVSSTDLEGSAAPLDIVFDEITQRAYVGKTSQTGVGDLANDFFVLNVSGTVVNGADITTGVNGIALYGNYAYLATGKDSAEIVMVHLTTMASTECDISGNQDATEIQIEGDRLFLGRLRGAQAEFAEYTITSSGTCGDFSLPVSTKQLLSSHDIIDMSVHPSEGKAFFVTGDPNSELLTMDLATLALTTKNLAGSKCDSVTFLGTSIYAGCRDNTATLQILQGTDVLSHYGTITSLPYDSGSSDASWQRISWTESDSANGTVSLRIRTADTLQNLKQAVWVGPDGTTGTAFTDPAGGTIVTDPLATGTRYIQWKAILEGTGETPVLEDVTLTRS